MFWKHKSVFLQILNQSSVPSNITLLYFFLAQPLYTLVKSNLLKRKFLRFSSAWVKISQIPHMNWQVNSPSNFASFFIAMTKKSPVNFKLIHFLLWAKGSHQSSNFGNLKCSGENFPNCSCHFSKQQVSFSSNFASLFSFMKDNSCVRF